MTTQPDALRLAAELQQQAVWEGHYGPSYLRDLLPEAAAELRRLYTEVDRLTKHILNQNKELDDLIPMAEKIETQRDELLNALQMVQQCLGGSDDPMLFTRTCKVVDAAIAKAEKNK